ncbi:MAG: hypothetical protein REI11_16645 [Patulibacter sp.]|nr:hypothetical protein [Patulibacter sp.]
MSKQPIYTALGWTVWHLGKRYAKKRVQKTRRGRRFLIFGTLGAAGAAAAYAALNAGSSES